MPLYDEYADQLRSEIADMINSGGRPAGACTAAMFLKEFAGDLPWAHLDIAGTAWADEGKPWQPKGPTGVAVRTLAELPFTSESWKLRSRARSSRSGTQLLPVVRSIGRGSPADRRVDQRSPSSAVREHDDRRR